jgi:hypothetical protein
MGTSYSKPAPATDEKLSQAKTEAARTTPVEQELRGSRSFSTTMLHAPLC